MEKPVANACEKPGNGDICAVLACLVSQEADRTDGPCAPTCAELGSLEAFRHDHAHHADRLPLLLRELAA
jgi:hypothetical protein